MKTFSINLYTIFLTVILSGCWSSYSPPKDSNDDSDSEVAPYCDVSNCIHGNCSTGEESRCNCEVGWDGDECDLCAAGYSLEGEDCINRKTVECSDAAPQNASSAVEEVELYFDDVYGWSPIPECVWHCNSDWVVDDEGIGCEPVSISDVATGSSHTCLSFTNGMTKCWALHAHSWVSRIPEVKFSGIAVGFGFACGLASNGSLQCWGADGYSVGVLDTPDGNFQTFGVGSTSGCGLDEDGSIACWGNEQIVNLAPKVDGFLEICVGEQHACAAHRDGVVDCWGEDTYGQTNGPEKEFSALACGRTFTCGLSPDGDVECWGNLGLPQQEVHDNKFLSLSAFGSGEFVCGVTMENQIECWGNSSDTMKFDSEQTYKRVSAGRRHACALTGDNAVVCEGADSILSRPHELHEISVGRGSTAVSHYGCGLKLDNTATCWGLSDSRTKIEKQETFLSIEAEQHHACGITTANTVSCLGLNDDGQCTVPVGIFEQVCVGWNYSCARANDGSVKCWGNNDYGQSSPPAEKFESITCGAMHACGLKNDGHAECWGDNSMYQLSTYDLQFEQISAGDSFSVGVLDDYTIEWWGDLLVGNCDYGYSCLPIGNYQAVDAGEQAYAAFTDKDQLELVLLSGEQYHIPGTFQDFSMGGSEVCAVNADNTVHCFNLQ